jgi:hypothetical protein
MIQEMNSSQAMQHYSHVVIDEFAHILLRLLGNFFLAESEST